MGGGSRPPSARVHNPPVSRLSAVALLLLAGCSVHVDVGASTARAVGLGLAGVVLIGEELRASDERVPPPALDPDRVVNEQDCTQPVDLAAGNLRCK
jgi:hypothetical protein